MDRDNDDDLNGLLRLTLDAYGGQPDRWPHARRQQLIAFTETDPEAARLIGEAQALDRLLNAAVGPQRSDVRLELVTKIMTAATMSADEGKPAAARALRDNNQIAEVVPFARTRQSQPSTGRPMTGRFRTARPRRRLGAGYWPAAAMLAASLLLGVFIGGTGQLNTPVTQLNAYLGNSTSIELAILLPNPVPEGFEQVGDDPL